MFASLHTTITQKHYRLACPKPFFLFIFELCNKHTGFAKVAVPFSADSFVVNETFVLRINISGENRHLRQAAKRQAVKKRSFPAREQLVE